LLQLEMEPLAYMYGTLSKQIDIIDVINAIRSWKHLYLRVQWVNSFCSIHVNYLL